MRLVVKCKFCGQTIGVSPERSEILGGYMPGGTQAFNQMLYEHFYLDHREKFELLLKRMGEVMADFMSFEVEDDIK
jgi:hypothetical protein